MRKYKNNKPPKHEFRKRAECIDYICRKDGGNNVVQLRQQLGMLETSQLQRVASLAKTTRNIGYSVEILLNDIPHLRRG